MEPRKNAMPRWAFNFENWKPTAEEWEKMLLLVQPEERIRLARFESLLLSHFSVPADFLGSKDRSVMECI